MAYDKINNDGQPYLLELNDGEFQNNKERLAKEFSEGCESLEKLLLLLWDNNIATIACCKAHTDRIDSDGLKKSANAYICFLVDDIVPEFWMRVAYPLKRQYKNDIKLDNSLLDPGSNFKHTFNITSLKTFDDEKENNKYSEQLFGDLLKYFQDAMKVYDYKIPRKEETYKNQLINLHDAISYIQEFDGYDKYIFENDVKAMDRYEYSLNRNLEK